MKSDYENKNLGILKQRVRRRQGLNGKVFIILDYDGYTREQGDDETNEQYRQFLLDNGIEFIELTKIND